MRPAILCILDGWGYREQQEDNAIALAPTPHWDKLWQNYPHNFLETSGLAVGLPEGQMGNSEVGHMNIGAGRVMMQDLPKIDQAIAKGTLASHPLIVKAIASLKKTGGRAHLLGLLSPGGVHSHQDHLAALVRLFDQEAIPVSLHVFLDGRDTPPQSAKGFVQKFLTDIAGTSAKIETISGRYYAMDRDQRWDRVHLAWQAIAKGLGPKHQDSLSAIEMSWNDGKTDEFVIPTVREGYDGIKEGDGLIMANFRADRAREILTALVDPDFTGFDRDTMPLPAYSCLIGMSDYSVALSHFFETLFPSESPQQILGEVVANAGLAQLRIAETEKYAHVTFFLNGGREEPFEKEERILVPSPKVATYDLMPEMSAFEVCDRLISAIHSQAFGLIIVNFANGDMVGHTGDMEAALKAVGVIDQILGRLSEAVLESGASLIITADHGNIEMMRDPETGEPHTAHTIGKVPVILVGAPSPYVGLKEGSLSDIAPSLLALMGLNQPKEMTGHSLLRGN